MLKILSNRLFQITLILSVAQQLLVAASTYIMLKVAKILPAGNISDILYYVMQFFAFIMIAYIPGSLSYYFLRKAQNSIWSHYVKNVYDHVGENPLKNTLHNQKKIHNWLTGEAKTTIEQFCFYIKDSVDIVLSIILNLSTIVYAVGPRVGMSIGISLLLGFIVIWLIKGRLEEYGNCIQESKNSLFILMDSFIDKITSLPKVSKKSLYRDLANHLNHYFHEENRNAFLEAIIPLTITLFAMFGVGYSFITSKNEGIAAISVLVVALPRLLQIFQYLYVIINYLQQYVFLRNKTKNILNFCSSITPMEPQKLIKFDQINIQYKSNELSYEELIKRIDESHYGLYTLSGKNGAGKSTLLKWLKSTYPESILITPDNNRNLGDHNLSSGQNLKTLLDNFLTKSKNCIILLDEWNANLDTTVEGEISSKITLAIPENIIIEVRHK